MLMSSYELSFKYKNFYLSFIKKCLLHIKNNQEYFPQRASIDKIESKSSRSTPTDIFPE